jgi:hypothetical protein
MSLPMPQKPPAGKSPLKVPKPKKFINGHDANPLTHGTDAGWEPYNEQPISLVACLRIKRHLAGTGQYQRVKVIPEKPEPNTKKVGEKLARIFVVNHPVTNPTIESIKEIVDALLEESDVKLVHRHIPDVRTVGSTSRMSGVRGAAGLGGYVKPLKIREAIDMLVW